MSDTGLPHRWIARLVPHWSAYCWCGARLLEGTTERGLPIFACARCKRACARRKVA